MRIPPQLLSNPDLHLLTFPGALTVQTSDFRAVVCRIDCNEAYARACRGEIEAVATSAGRIKYFRLLRADERPVSLQSETAPTWKTREPLAAALRTYYEDTIAEFRVPTLCLARGNSYVRWPEDARFADGRFNPDSLATRRVPVQPPVGAPA